MTLTLALIAAGGVLLFFLGMARQPGSTTQQMVEERLQAYGGEKMLTEDELILRKPFSERFVFPDGVPLPLSRITLALERAGIATTHVEGLQDDYAATLRHWIDRYEARYDDAVRLAGAERARVWRLYLHAARLGFVTGWASIYQVLAHRPSPDLSRSRNARSSVVAHDPAGVEGVRVRRRGGGRG